MKSQPLSMAPKTQPSPPVLRMGGSAHAHLPLAKQNCQLCAPHPLLRLLCLPPAEADSQRGPPSPPAGVSPGVPTPAFYEGAGAQAFSPPTWLFAHWPHHLYWLVGTSRAETIPLCVPRCCTEQGQAIGEWVVPWVSGLGQDADEASKSSISLCFILTGLWNLSRG